MVSPLLQPGSRLVMVSPSLILRSRLHAPVVLVRRNRRSLHERRYRRVGGERDQSFELFLLRGGELGQHPVSPSHCSGGLPTPKRNRSVSPVPRYCRMLRKPLCPASPPPCFTWIRPNSKSISSCATRIPSAGTLQNRAACPTASPLRFMNACGSRTAMSRVSPTKAFHR